MSKKLLIFFLSYVFLLNTYAQNPVDLSGNELLFREGLELMEKEKFGPARTKFEQFLLVSNDELKSAEAQYFIALSAIKLYHNDGEYLVEEFIQENPDNPKARLAYYELGNFNFQEKNYDKAAEYFEKADVKVLSPSQRAESYFKTGYAYLSEKQFDQALESFNKAKNLPGSYQPASSYYAGYIEYSKGLYADALSDFQRAAQDEAYKTVVPYLISNIYFKQRRYNELLDYASTALKMEEVKNREEIRQLVGETYYLKGDYTQAADYLSDYVTKQRNPSSSIVYKLAFSQYQLGQSEPAIQNFKKIAAVKDTLGQYASYYLGVLYVEEGNKNFALAAFDQAAKQDFNQRIRQEAWWQFAKINYDLGQYNEAITSLQSFSKTFPNSDYRNEVNDLLGQAFLKTTNYQLAIEHIESLDYKSPGIREVYQKVTFYKGTEFFNTGEYYQSVQMFNKSLEYPIVQDLVHQGHYWSGEAYSIGRFYDDAIKSYTAVTSNASPGSIYYLKSRYGLGYAYYNLKRYELALPHFRFYTEKLENNSNKMFYSDALIRLADCYYASKDYGRAISLYDKAIVQNNPDRAYAFYQKGVIYNIQNQYDLAIRNLNTVLQSYRDSRVYDEALFELAQVYFDQGKYQEAVMEFTNLIKNQPNSVFVPYALQNRAIANYNLKQYDRTVEDYKRIVNNYPTSDIASSALLGLQEALALQGRAEEFSGILTQYKRNNPDDSNLASIEYESAKTLYFNQNYRQAIDAFQAYMEDYPNHPNSYEARYFIGDSHYRLGNSDQALASLKQVASDNQSAYVNRAVQRMGEIQFQMKNYRESISSYRQLAGIAKNKKEQYNAWSGLMEAYFNLESYDSVRYFANQILDRATVNANAQNQAYLYLGKAAYRQGQYDKAVDEFLQAVNSAKDQNGAEAQYLTAQIYYEQGNFNQSIETLYDLNKNFPVYDEWLGKSFLLIAENYVKLEENFQAQATLKSIIENSPVESIRIKAQERLSELKAEEDKNQEDEADTLFFPSETVNEVNEP
jgi:tetratricopeptide (TPR) repeat protein